MSGAVLPIAGATMRAGARPVFMRQAHRPTQPRNELPRNLEQRIAIVEHAGGRLDVVSGAGVEPWPGFVMLLPAAI